MGEQGWEGGETSGELGGAEEMGEAGKKGATGEEEGAWWAREGLGRGPLVHQPVWG